MNSESSCTRLTVADAMSRVPTAEGKRFATIFEHGTLQVEIYAPRGTDPQQPHARDEIYFVATGNGEFVCGEARTPFRPADILFAAAGVEHRFENFTDDLAVWVLFYGPEGGEVAGESFAQKVFRASPRLSGRLKIAQRFIAGMASMRDEVRETDD